MTCGRTCGTDYEFSSKTSVNSRIKRFKILTERHGWVSEGEKYFDEYVIVTDGEEKATREGRPTFRISGVVR